MADLTTTNDRLIKMWAGLTGIDDLSPPMLPKGQYVLSKAAIQMEPLVQKYEKQRNALAKSFAKRDENGKVVTSGNGYVLADAEAFNEEHDKLLAEEVVITGTRIVTRAEIGQCPITQKTVRFLLGYLIEDVEPTG